jgi:DNA-binding NarL/FixJ family response regulator
MTILSVDDSPLIAQQLICILKEINNIYYLGNAHSLKAAHEMLAIHNPEIVILDLKLKEENGIELLEFLRNNNPKTKTIILSNQNDTFYKNKCIQMGALVFLDKSYEFDKLIDCITQIQDTNP